MTAIDAALGSTPIDAAPSSAAELAALLGECARARRRVRTLGGATKAGWGHPIDPLDVRLSTAALDAIVAHDPGDMTAVMQAGVPLGQAQQAFAGAGQMLALDPPLGARTAATIGGIVASADTGPLRHRFGGVRDLVLGATVALPDGSLARAGGRVIKNVAGYDLAKLYCGSFGTLGVIVEIAVRLHPLAPATVTAVGGTERPRQLAAAALALAHAPLDALCLDLRWQDERGALLARFGGRSARHQARATGRRLAALGLEPQLVEDDEELWTDQREGQRAGAGEAVVRVATLLDGLERTIVAARELGAALVARAALGVCWLRLPTHDPPAVAVTVSSLRERLAPASCVLLDAPAAARTMIDPWGPVEATRAQLQRRVKQRFDPAGTCNPGLFAGGL